MKPNRVLLILMLSVLSCLQASASHIVGGEFTYRFLGDTLIPPLMYHRYQVSLSIYQDCENGQPDAIAEDNPAFLGVYDGMRNLIQMDTGVTGGIYFTTTEMVPANFNNSCVTNIPRTCLIKKTFIKTYYLAPNTSGYVIAYQRCCRNNAIVNIQKPGDNGSTYYCTIPPSPRVNNSAVFNNYPPQIICVNNPLYYDHSAFDPDGDSLSYEYCQALEGATGADIKPAPLPPPYDSVKYVNPPYSYKVPLTGFPAIQVNPVTGLITGTPNRLGRYLVTVCVNEWRNGVIINTTKREFQFVVTNCSKVVVADIPQFSTDPNTYIVNCTDFDVFFVNKSTGGFAYRWDFGVTNRNDDTSIAFQPTFTYPDTGTFVVRLVVNPASTCPDSIVRFVKVYPKFRADFTNTGKYCPGDSINFTDLTTAFIKPINFWKWSFGDGDSTFEQNPVHAYQRGGTYYVTLISQNIKTCVDTAVKPVLIQTFKPFVGDDTIIVKGESIQFNALGGVKYAWVPPDNLSATDIYNPVGYYPETGTFTYYVDVESAFGCRGTDTVKVTVVNMAQFFVPNAFSPNGDGHNDVFRPIAVGYRGLNYFRVYNRFGEQVYHSTSLESGWNGDYKDKQADLGVYYWQISFTDRFGKEGFLKGDVTLVR